MKKLLLVNDDGLFAPGLAALRKSLKAGSELSVIAPDQENSGMSQAITVHRPLRLTKVERGYMLDGTPADCVKMGLRGLDLSPDFILSGINNGSNLGWDVLYSGTVGAAMEGALHGVPSLAFSLCGSITPEAFETALVIVHSLLYEKPGFLIQPELIPKGGILNINIPAIPLSEIKGIRLTRLGVRNYDGVMQQRTDPRGQDYYWMGGVPVSPDSDELNLDVVAVERGYVSITPLKCDITFFEAITNLQEHIQ